MLFLADSRLVKRDSISCRQLVSFHIFSLRCLLISLLLVSNASTSVQLLWTEAATSFWCFQWITPSFSYSRGVRCAQHFISNQPTFPFCCGKHLITKLPEVAKMGNLKFPKILVNLKNALMDICPPFRGICTHHRFFLFLC